MIILCAFVYSIGTLFGVYSNNLDLISLRTKYIDLIFHDNWHLNGLRQVSFSSSHLSYQFPCLSIKFDWGFDDLK